METWKKQTLLAYLEYLPYEDIDDIWGEQTQKATEAFQRDYQITVDGIFGNGTLARILDVIATGEKPLVSEDQATSDFAEDSNVPSTIGTFWDHIRYWKREEFACRCGRYHAPYCDGFPVEPDQTLVELVDDIRHDFGRPAHPSSGIRCEQHNADQPNSAPDSRHKRGKALDFFIEGVSGAALLARAQADPRTNYAYIIEGQYVHVDVK